MTDFTPFLERLADVVADRAGPVGPLRGELERLHAGFTTTRAGRPPIYLGTSAARRAYLACFGLPNAARALHVLAATGAGLGAGERGLDAGAGPGVTSLALAALSDPGSEIVLVDRDVSALREARELFRALFPEGPRASTRKMDLSRGGRSLPSGPFRTVVAGHLLNELLPRRGRDPGRARPVARALADRVALEGTLVLLEPAQRVPSRALCGIRASLLESDLTPLYPCTHGRRCPVLAPRARDWCVVDVPWRRPPLVADVDRLLRLDRRRIAVSCLAATPVKTTTEDRLHEVLSEPMPAGRDTVIYLCGAAGRIAIRLSRPPSRPILRGDRVLLPEGRPPSGRDRSGAPLLHLSPSDLLRVRPESGA